MDRKGTEKNKKLISTKKKKKRKKFNLARNERQKTMPPMIVRGVVRQAAGTQSLIGWHIPSAMKSMQLCSQPTLLPTHMHSLSIWLVPSPRVGTTTQEEV